MKVLKGYNLEILQEQKHSISLQLMWWKTDARWGLALAGTRGRSVSRTVFNMILRLGKARIRERKEDLLSEWNTKRGGC